MTTLMKNNADTVGRCSGGAAGRLPAGEPPAPVTGDANKPAATAASDDKKGRSDGGQ